MTAQTYKTSEGDVLDAIAYQHYGVQSPDVLFAIFEANPGLAELGGVLAQGITITLPQITTPATTATGLSLWD